MVRNFTYDWTSFHKEIEHNGLVYLPNFGKDCSITSPNDLSDVLGRWPVEWNPYLLGQSRRRKLAGQVYTASEYSNARTIPAHHELSYTPTPPKWIVFYAHRAVEEGCMHLLDGRRLYEALETSKWKNVLHQEIIYRKCMPTESRIGFGKTWQEHFESADQIRVSELMNTQGITYRWLSSGDLLIEHRMNVCKEHAAGSVWFAQPRLWHLPFRGLGLFQGRLERQYWPTDVSWGNGSNISIEFLQWLAERETEFATRLHLGSGGLLIVDNHRVAHGREPYVGERQHWVAMGI